MLMMVDLSQNLTERIFIMSKINLEKLFEDEMNALHPLLVPFAEKYLSSTNSNSVYTLLREYSYNFSKSLSSRDAIDFMYDHQDFWEDWLDTQYQADFLHECTMVEVAKMYANDYFLNGVSWKVYCRLIRLYIINQVMNNASIDDIDAETVNVYLNDDVMWTIYYKSLDVANQLALTIVTTEIK